VLKGTDVRCTTVKRTDEFTLLEIGHFGGGEWLIFSPTYMHKYSSAVTFDIPDQDM
jgi:hypothetical protein